MMRRYNLVLIVGLVVLTIASGDDSVLVKSMASQTGTISSNTLKWLPKTHYNEGHNDIVIGGFKRTHVNDAVNNSAQDERPMFVCRAYHGGVWVAGTNIKGEDVCQVSFGGIVATYHRFELLENVENAARWGWVPWSHFNVVPDGAIITFTNLFVARHKVSNVENNNVTSSTYSHYIGTLSQKMKETFGAITYVKDNQTESSKVGEVLVQTEPISYELKSVKYYEGRKKVKNEPTILGSATFRNTDSAGDKFAQAFTYKYGYFSDWGHVHATITDLDTSITLINGTRVADIRWGLDTNTTREDVYDVEIYLEPGTGVNVTVWGNYIDMEVPYSGQLISHYADGETKPREIIATHKEKTMTDIKPDFGPIFFLNNNSFVPTTLPPPTTTPRTTQAIQKTVMPSTTTVVETTTKSPDISAEENMIMPPRESGPPNNDGGPLSLKNKENSSYSFKICISVLLTSLGVSLYRIT